MKKYISLISLILLAVMLFCGCSKQEEKTNVLNCAWNSEPTSFDITKYNGADNLKIIWNIYEPLVRISDGKLTPAGASEWGISEDGLCYTFTIRENYWNDGIKVTADDYAQMLRRMADPANLFANASDYYCILNFEKVNTGELSVDQLGVQAVDETTLQINLEYKNNEFLTGIELYPERADIVEAYGQNYGYSSDNMVCCGPFSLAEWDHNSKLVLKKNNKYWDSQSIDIDEINIKIIPDSGTRMLEFSAGNIDYLAVSDEDMLQELRKNDDLYEVSAASARTYMFLFNCKDAVFGNTKIRQAFSLAISREEICSILDNSLTTPAFGLIPPSTMVGQTDYRAAVKEPLKELVETNVTAKELLLEGLSELNIDDADDLTVVYSCPNDSTSRTLAEYYKEMWEKSLGVHITIESQEFATYRSLIWSDEYQIASTAWGGSLEPTFLLSRWLPDNQCQWDSEEYAQLLNSAITQTDDDIRLNQFAEVEKMLIADQAVIAPIKYDGYSVFYRNYVKNTEAGPFDNIGFRNMRIEK